MDVPSSGPSDAAISSAAGSGADRRAPWQTAGTGERMSTAFAARVDAATGDGRSSVPPAATAEAWAELALDRSDLAAALDPPSVAAVRGELVDTVRTQMAQLGAHGDPEQEAAATAATADAARTVLSWHRRQADDRRRSAAGLATAYVALADAYEAYADTVDRLTAEAPDEATARPVVMDAAGRLGRAQEAFGTAVSDNAAEAQRLLIDRFLHHNEVQAARLDRDPQALSAEHRPQWLTQDVALERVAALGRDQVIEGRYRAGGRRLPRTTDVARELAGLARAVARAEQSAPASTTFDPEAAIERTDVFGRPENRYDINRLPGSALLPGEASAAGPSQTQEAAGATEGAAPTSPTSPTSARPRRPGPVRPRPSRRTGTERWPFLAPPSP